MTEADVIQPSASIASVGKGIRYVENYAYAYSGQFEAKNTTQILLEFVSGSGLIVGTFYCNVFLQYSNISVRQGAFLISLNDIIVAGITATNANEQMPATVTQELLIPPVTKVKVEAIASTDDSDNFATVNFTGRVYGAT